MRSFLKIAILIAFVSCETPSDCTEQYFSKEFESYMFFKDGSYWVYEDTALGITDSIYLDYQYVSFDEHCSVSSKPHEELEQGLISSYFEGNNNFSWKIRTSAEMTMYVGIPVLGMYRNYGDLFVDSMLVKDVWYKDVKEFAEPNTYNFCWAKGIGLIKKEFGNFTEGDTVFHFDLVRYHIEK